MTWKYELLNLITLACLLIPMKYIPPERRIWKPGYVFLLSDIKNYRPTGPVFFGDPRELRKMGFVVEGYVNEYKNG